jgi:hypothetical protein
VFKKITVLAAALTAIVAIALPASASAAREPYTTSAELDFHTSGAGGSAAIHITSNVTGGFCPVQYLVLRGGTITATPNQPTNFSSFQLNGTLVTDKITNSGQMDQGGETQISGLLTVSDPHKSTYSI